VILVYGIGHADFDVVVRGIERLLASRPSPDRWIDLPAILDRRQ